jgi:hypothetical protein
MRKTTMFLRRQAKKAELMAQAISELEASQRVAPSTKAFGGQADMPEKKENGREGRIPKWGSVSGV